MTTLALQRAEAPVSATSADQPFRTATGGLIDRNRPRDFSFDGRRLTGFQGDTLASALLANGVRLVGRSFKYHRPRGILSAGSEEPNALVELRSGARREPNTRATMAELYEGLEATSQNRWPSLALDALVAEIGGGFRVAGSGLRSAHPITPCARPQPSTAPAEPP
jgi:sarcosine oxidase subunit alpha